MISIEYLHVGHFVILNNTVVRILPEDLLAIDQNPDLVNDFKPIKLTRDILKVLNATFKKCSSDRIDERAYIGNLSLSYYSIYKAYGFKFRNTGILIKSLHELQDYLRVLSDLIITDDATPLLSLHIFGDEA